jgi:hypothetical protein
MLCKPPNVQIFILQICSATPIQDMNTSAPIYKEGEAPKKLVALRLFVQTMPFYQALATGNGNNEF